jgi:hypothetical protein
MKTASSLVLITASATLLRAASIISPPVAENASLSSPFLDTTNNAPSVRYQQVYGASDFGGQGSPQYLISEIRFSGGPGSGPIDFVVPNVQISFSTTARSPDSLSPVFGENIGANSVLVFSGPIDWTAGSGGGSGSFGFLVPLQQPFLYDWSAGNLLMDVRNYQTRPPPPFPLNPPLFAGVGTLGDSTSLAIAYDVNSPNAQFLTTGGLLTMFTVTGVPEPSAVYLLLTGLSAVVLLAWRRRGNARADHDVGGTR